MLEERSLIIGECSDKLQEQLKGDGTLYTIYSLIASEAQISGGYTITPKLKGSWVQAFP